MVITNEQAVRYENDGFLFPLAVMGRERAKHYRRQFNELEVRIGKEKAQVGILDAHFSERFVWELATNSDILDAVEAVIGPNILLLGTHFICKYGFESPVQPFVAWHQDVTYWGLEPALAVTAWYAVDDSDGENGCMRVIPCTHHAGIREHGKSNRPGNLLRINQAVQVAEVDEHRAVDIILRAGEISLHDGRVIHGSLPNQSNRRRCGLAMKYVPTKVRQLTNRSHTRSKAILVRGEDHERHFAAVEPPFKIA